MAFEATPQQKAFTEALINEPGNLALLARAGCGKTSTIIMGVKTLISQFPDREIHICAFNKAIADEMSEKLREEKVSIDWADRKPPKVQVSTVHSLGFGLVKFLFKPTIEANKVRNIVNYHAEFAAEGDEVIREYKDQIVSMVKYAKGEGFGFFPDAQIGDSRAWYDLADHYDINGIDDTSQMDEIIKWAQRVYKESLQQTDVIDFDDMILFPLVKNIRVRFGKDFIFVDEAQDLSRSRQALIKKFLKPYGRMFIVGDDRQAIYGFSGADADALPNMIKSLDAKVLPLSITWRCPKAVVRVAQRLVSDIEAAATAPEGEVIKIHDIPADIDTADAILCRNMAPLITVAYQLIREGKPAKVEGRDLGKNLDVLVKRWKVKTIDALLTRIENYREREVQKAQAKNQDHRIDEIDDRCNTVKEIANVCLRQGKKSVDDVSQFITDLFSDNVENATTLATYHRSKGREWDRVILWEHDTRCPSKRAKQEWQKRQEDNLAYVAYTRAKKTLAFLG